MDWPSIRARLVPMLHDLALRRRGPAASKLSKEDRRDLHDRFERVLREYAENLPYRPVSRCPVCDGVLEIAIDDLGLDGPWWWDACPLEFPRPRGCEHFLVFLGALDLHGRRPSEVTVWSVLPGPGAPFVIPRLLGIEGVRAVVSTVPIASRDTGYLVAYFGAEPVPEPDLHQEWRKQSWLIHDAEGNAVATEVVNDPWDFDLPPRIRDGEVLWIAPRDGALALHAELPSPYDAPTGARKKQMLMRGEVKLAEPPRGEPSGYYDPA